MLIIIIYSYQKKYGLDAFTQSDSYREKVSAEKRKRSFWEAFEATKFDESQPSVSNQSYFEHSHEIEANKDSKERKNTLIDNEDESEDEKNGECVGFDGDSERSEDEEMNEEDLAFLDDNNVRSGTFSHLSLLNTGRYEDDDLALKR